MGFKFERLNSMGFNFELSLMIFKFNSNLKLKLNSSLKLKTQNSKLT